MLSFPPEINATNLIYIQKRLKRLRNVSMNSKINYAVEGIRSLSEYPLIVFQSHGCQTPPNGYSFQP